MQDPEDVNINAPLKYKWLIFCEEYVKDENGTRAAKIAGFSEHTATSQASRLLTNVNIQAKIEELKMKRLMAKGITTDDIVLDIKRMGDKAELAGEFNAAIRSREILGRGVLWDKAGQGVVGKAVISPDNVTIEFTQGEISQGEISAKDNPT